MEKYSGSASALVADVDCTAEGKPLCEEHGVQGFPTIKWGDPSALEDYDGGRDLEALESFAEENLKPLCSPANLDLCDDDKKKQIAELMAKSVESLEAEIEKKESEQKEAEETFEAEVKKLQEKYEALDKEKTEKQKAIKDAGLGLMKAVKASRGSKKDEM
jgi:DNA repair exonuclease SbcCD ATPase subunit